MEPIPLVRKASIAPAISYLAAEGVPVRRYLRRSNLSAPSPDDLETLVPLHQVCDFLSSVAQAEGIDDLGFRVLGQHGMEHLGRYGLILAQALTLHEMVQISLELVASYNSGLEIWMERHQGQVRYCQKYAESLPKDRITEVVHYGLASALSSSQYARGVDWRPTRIELASDPIDLTEYFPGFADLPVAFNQPQTAIWLDQKALSSPLVPFECPPADDGHRQAFLESAPSTDPVDQLEQAVESVLSHPRISLPITAAIIGTSPRTLQRRLADHNTSFSRTLQAVRFRNARCLLQDPEIRLKEIAKRLGYTDLANFIRAFKRWTGVGPSEFRRLHYRDGYS